MHVQSFDRKLGKCKLTVLIAATIRALKIAGLLCQEADVLGAIGGRQRGSLGDIGAEDIRNHGCRSNWYRDVLHASPKRPPIMKQLVLNSVGSFAV